MLRLYLRAPFAACRTFTAGWYRPTASFLTPSAAYGFLLNLAGIEGRVYEHEPEHDGRVPASLSRAGLPRCRLAVGLPAGAEGPQVQSIFQQLHNYPVGTSGSPPEMAMGNKNNITPVRREVLVGLQAVIAIDPEADGALEERVLRGLRGELNSGRYGLPFVGDNNFLADRIEVLPESKLVRWYQRVDPAARGPGAGVSRLTIAIDRADMSRTRSDLFAPAETATLAPPDAAWVYVGRAE